MAYGQLDLKFRNNLPKPVRIRAKVVGEKLLVEILSRYKLPYSVEIISKEETISPPQYVLLGEMQTFPPPRRGYKVEVYRILLRQGEEIKRELLSSDEYPPLPFVVRR